MKRKELSKRLQITRKQQHKLIKSSINHPILIDRDTFQAILNQGLPRWSYINNIGSCLGKYLHKCKYNGKVYASETEIRIEYK